MKSSKLFHQSYCWLRSQYQLKRLVLQSRSATSSKHFHNGNSSNQKPESIEELPQLRLPDWDKEIKFKGLETDFPCLSKIPSSGPEPTYENVLSGYQICKLEEPFHMKLNNGVLPQVDIAYETWGELMMIKVMLSSFILDCHLALMLRATRIILLLVGGRSLLGQVLQSILINSLSSAVTYLEDAMAPLTNQPYGTTFPMVTVDDIVNAQFKLLDKLGIGQIHASVGSSLGGMCSLSAGALYPDRVKRVISISACLSTYPTSIGLRYLQRRAIMMDPNWNRGHYYGKSYPRMGMKLARELATITYRSGPEWHERFGRKVINEDEQPSLCPYFMIESYIEYQGESFSTKFDPNTLLYISKAMDLFDMGEGFASLEESVKKIQCPVLVLGVQTDMLIPSWQQKEVVEVLRKTGNDKVTYYELDSLFGHDTFLLDLSNVGGAIKGSLETNLKEVGTVRKEAPKWMTYKEA
ncbi:putative serine-O-acetyltransferase cys2 [Apostichopus japonicus]|uniref:Putative serine-O-acetyltransferase cys2 n=1 Tax=Stichopus japonicus TaxID=307972 RepID=A0A2G8KJR5_STIJA|nr:putative serine-O-acetyltransferase cys2 [Apostichopus japonicus]